MKKLNWNFNRYELFLSMFVLGYSYTMFATHHIFAVVSNRIPTWICEDNSTSISNTSTKFSQSCDIRSNCTGKIVEKYDLVSMVSEFSLSCEAAYVGPLVATIQMTGLLFGSVIFGQLSDLYGRKKVVLASVTGMMVFSTLSILMQSWQAVAVFRFFVGFSIGGYIVGLFTLVIEAIKPEQRLAVRSIFSSWGFGRLAFTLAAYLTQNWRYTVVAINIFCCPILILLIFFVQESPRWLIQHHKTEEAKRVLRRIGNFNRILIVEDELDHLDEVAPDDRKYTIADLFSSSELRKRTLLASYFYFAVACVGYGMDLKTGNLSGGFWSNQFIMGVGIMLGKPLVIIPDHFIPGFSRRVLHQFSLGVCLVLLVIVLTLSEVAPNNQWSITWVRICSVVFMIIIEWHWDSVYLYATELFPTVCRTVGLSTAAIFGRIGSLLAPQIILVSTLWDPAAYIIFLAIGALSVILSYFLAPETKGQPLPDNLKLETVELDQFETKEALVKHENIAPLN